MKKLLSRLFLLSALFVAPAFAADTPTTGTRVTVYANAKLPDAQALVKALELPGEGRREVRVKQKVEGEHRTLTLELWGNTVASSEIEQTLRAKFPSLAKAQIAVEPINEAPPAIDEKEGVPGHGKRVIIKKEIRETDEAPPTK